MLKNIKISQLQCNTGQIQGLPRNPRTIKDARFEALKKSIEDAPEMLNLRELLVFPHNDKFVVIGGNMRLKACKDLGFKELPCKVLDENTPVEKLREYAIKDNIGFGDDDWDALGREWNLSELENWGLEMPNFDGEYGENDDSPVGEKLLEQMKNATFVEKDAYFQPIPFVTIFYTPEQKDGLEKLLGRKFDKDIDTFTYEQLAK